MEKLRPDQLREKANMLPLLPGVYIMLDEHGEVIYIGKAKALKNRVTSYFRGEHLPKVAAMVAHVADFNVIVVQSEFEALVLENSLIKLHKPSRTRRSRSSIIRRRTARSTSAPTAAGA